MQDVEKTLQRYGTLRRIIKECKALLADLRAEQVAFLESQMRLPPLDHIRSKGGPVSDPTFRAAQIDIEHHGTRIRAAAEELAGYQDEYDAIERRIRAAGLTEVERRYLELRWGEGLSVSDIAEKMGYCERQTQRVRMSLTNKIRILGRG